MIILLRNISSRAPSRSQKVYTKFNMRIGKIVSSFIFLLVLLIFSAVPVKASLVLVDSQGKVVINVLSSEDTIELEIPRRDYLEIKDIVEETPDPDAKVYLVKEDGKIILNVETQAGEKSLDVTNYQEKIVEIEERPEVERITIGVRDDNFTIEQRGVVAETDFSIIINPKTAGLTLETPSGFRFLSILPHEAVEVTLRSKVINEIEREEAMFLIEEAGELSYEVTGDKVINLFNIIKYSVSVKTRVSALTGEIIFVDQPTWLRVLGFLFT